MNARVFEARRGFLYDLISTHSPFEAPGLRVTVTVSRCPTRRFNVEGEAVSVGLATAVASVDAAMRLKAAM